MLSEMSLAKQKYWIGCPVTFGAKQNTCILHLSFCWLKHNFYDQRIPHPVIHLQFLAYGSWDSPFPISMSPTANSYVQNTIFNDKSTILLHTGTRWNKNFSSRRQNYAQKMQDEQVTKSLHINLFEFSLLSALIMETSIVSMPTIFTRSMFYHSFKKHMY